MPTPLPRPFTYAHADTVASGSRVRIPFGPRAVIGVVVGEGVAVKVPVAVGVGEAVWVGVGVGSPPGIS